MPRRCATSWASSLGRGVCREAVLLATCNRVEVYGVSTVPGQARDAALRLLGRPRGLDLADVTPHLYTWTDAEAVRHAFRVASSLDSLVVGEPQILGQVKDAFALAQVRGGGGPGPPRADEPGVRRGQARAHGDRDRPPCGVGLVRGRRARPEDLRHPGGPLGSPPRRGRDGGAGRQAPDGARNAPGVRGQPHRGAGRRSRPRPRRGGRALRSGAARARGRRHRDRLHRRARAGGPGGRGGGGPRARGPGRCSSSTSAFPATSRWP